MPSLRKAKQGSSVTQLFLQLSEGDLRCIVLCSKDRLVSGSKEKVITLLIRLSGTNHILGHKLRVKNFPEPSKQIHIPYLIVGGGITGLSAARQLFERGIWV